MQKQNTNRFASFEVADEAGVPVQAKAKAEPAQKKPAPEKKIVVQKVTKAAIVDDGQGAFDEVQQQRPQTAGPKGGRGGKGGEQGGRGGRGGRGGEGRGRGGQQRGGRPRTGRVDETGTEVERAEAGGQRQRYQGKAREDAHPFDRQDGTGKAHRGDRKGGNQKGGWGDEKKVRDEEVGDAVAQIDADKKAAEKKPRGDRGDRRGDRKDRGERKEREDRGDRRRKAQDEEKEAEPEPVEEEEVGFTLDDYLNQEAAKTHTVQLTGKGRKNEKIDTKGLESLENNHAEQFALTNDTDLTGRDMHVIKAGEGAELLSFTAPVIYEEPRRGGRKDQNQGPKPKGRKGKMVIDDNDFPSFN